MSYDRPSSKTTRQGTCRRPLPALATLSVLAAMLLGRSPDRAEAGLVLMAENGNASAGGTGSFDVVLADTVATGGTFNVSAFSVELKLAAGSGATFTGVTVGTTVAPYIFGSLQSPPLSFATFPTTDFIGSDSDFTGPNYYVTLAPGQTLGLEHVSYSIAPGTSAGSVTVSIVNGSGTSLSDVSGGALPFTTTGGTITITPSAVPEPPSIVAWAVAATCLLLVFICRRLLIL